jgi:glycosyltransferase involved in cell wall biosynthesis
LIALHCNGSFTHELNALDMVVDKTRVAFFAEILTEGFDGAVRTMYQLIDRIDHDRFEFLFIIGSGPDTLRGFECLKVPAVSLPINTTYSMALPILAQSRIREKLDAFMPDVIHVATPSPLGHFALKVARQYNIPVLTIYHTHFISYTEHYLKHLPFLIPGVKKMIADGYRSFYDQCQMVYVPSVSMCNELIAIGVSAGNFKIWERGIDINMFHPGKRDVDLMRKLTGNDRPVILFASRLVWEKNLETLIRVYTQLQQRCPYANFVVVGDGVALAECEAAMPNAIFTGKADHEMLSILYASADVFVFPSVSETYGNVVQEAMASGLPCVIANGGGSKEFIEDGVNGFKCDPYNEHSYTDKILTLLQDPSLRRGFIQKGLEQSTKNNWAQLANDYFADILRLAHRHKAVVM